MEKTQQILFLALLVSVLHFSEAKPHCNPSACGNIRRIKYPFRLKGDPNHCGDPRFELACENNVTSISLNSHKYYVKAINYGSSRIRLVDASVNNDDIFSFPNSSAYHYNFTFLQASSVFNTYSTSLYDDPHYDVSPINFMSCPHPLTNSSLFSVSTTHSNSSHHRYTYVKVGSMIASEFPETCELEVTVMTSWKFKDLNNVSLSEIHQSLLYGFELTFCTNNCQPWPSPTNWVLLPILLGIVGLICALVSNPVLSVVGLGAVSLFLFNTGFLLYVAIRPLHNVVTSARLILLVIDVVLAPRIVIFPLVLWLLIYKFRRRRLSTFDAIECYLQSDNKLAPIRYSYSDIKRMTKGFQVKLGEGGYGSVYKGKLRSGHDVAIKLLGKSRGNGQDFMNEIATIGRIHHVNVVKLVGYCAHGSKRALVYDFMSNGSLEKYLFNPEKMNSLNWNIKFEIAVGVARGIEYLHRGCDVQILHFDIKPHNILLDGNFIPKVSDFGLAKFFSTDKNAVTMTACRGTIGYVAPELISRSIGVVSYKADVYSFGMLLMEMVNLKRDSMGENGDSDQYFPYWIYDHINQGKDIVIGKADSDEDDNMREVARKMTIVSLWCIQMNPDDRPPMNKVLEMLEADVERLLIPDYPSQSTESVVNVDLSGMTWSSADSVRLVHDEDDAVASSLEITVQE